MLNRKGTTLRMLNENTKIQIPVLVSNKGYGLFWDNYSITNFAGNVSSNTRYSFSSEAGDLVDYYFFYGPTIDQVIANYRTDHRRGADVSQVGLRPLPVEGPLPELRRADGRSERLSQQQHPGRRHRSGLAVLEPAVWGSHLMDASRFPDPAAIVNQLHAAHIHTMISIWPLYQTRSNGMATVAGELDNYNALNAINALTHDHRGRHLPLLRPVQRRWRGRWSTSNPTIA